jgi:hypothetical protein
MCALHYLRDRCRQVENPKFLRQKHSSPHPLAHPLVGSQMGERGWLWRWPYVRLCRVGDLYKASF